MELKNKRNQYTFLTAHQLALFSSPNKIRYHLQYL
nr:MAG TPA: hypothetical protein [Caudoviricetes sp.]